MSINFNFEELAIKEQNKKRELIKKTIEERVVTLEKKVTTLENSGLKQAV